MDLLKEWKGKIKETFKDVVGELDPAEKRLSDAVERATAPTLPGPDLALNLAIADEVNANPSIAVDAVTRAIRRAFLKPNTQVQLLALALLEMVVKNALPAFFQHLATSELYAELLRVGDPTRRWDAEVRDRVLCLVEDWGRGLPLHAFKEGYEGLVDRGVDFPVRQLPDSDGVPYYTPPELSPQPQPYQQQQPQAYGAPPAMAPGAAYAVPGAGYAVPGGGGPLIGPDVSAEDAAAIRAAMAEMEAEAAAAGGPAPGAAGSALGAGALGAQQLLQAAGAPGPAAAPAPAPAPGLPALPRDPESLRTAVSVAANSAELLAEMLAPITAAAASGGDASGVREAFVTDLADQCYRHRSVLAEAIPFCEDEELLSAALAANDDLSRALRRFEELSGTARPPAPASRGPASSGGGAGPAFAGGAAAGAAPALAATFSLLDEGEEEEAPELLTNRTGLGLGAPAAPAAVGAPAPLIDLGGEEHAAAPAAAAASGSGARAAAASTSAAADVGEGLSRLGLSEGGSAGAAAKPAQP
ncbi:hypothetical protein Rsub_12223 [Raphidocelis subcapitata]|uniref:VHS domain-containing protein n=1 Tax=Raphidocelis subcapitata TaxID=307507 RepID=A0A2V0PNS7_9CHLO|nr:hypothetical protein Rsub_12223 [Raphidocelis subcapitata]|eukprot:GBF99783.1 hypothetical protein Rsub_12223 [Raphidocelis subcapitata]